MVAKNRSNEIRIIRVYDAPLSAVWDAWTDVEQVAKWWGPRGFTLTTHSKDLRPGGHWSYTMHGPDGTDYENRTLYYEVKEHEKLVYDHGGAEDRPPLFRVTALFSESGGKTKLDMTFAFESVEVAEQMGKFIKQAGGDSTWDRLAEYLEHEATGTEKFVINRSFDAPLETVYEMWTNPKHLAQWLPPVGFEMQFIRADIKTGGGSFFMMTNHRDVKMYARAEYLKIEKPGCLVYTQQFCDEHENISRHPMAPVWPATMLTTVQLTPEGPERTRVTVTTIAHGPATPEEIAFFANARAGMTMGWTGSFDKLEEFLVKG